MTLFERTKDALAQPEDPRQLEQAGVRYIESQLRGVTMGDAMRPILHTDDGEAYEFDVLYPMLGETARSDLASALGAATVQCSELLVDSHQMTNVPGLYAIGDVTQALNQISVAAGQAASAATRIHNSLPHHFRAKPAPA